MRREAGMFFALVVLSAILAVSNIDFIGQSNVLDNARQVAMLGILAIGSAFVIIAGGIDLSVGSLVGLTGVIIAKISSPASDCFGLPIWAGIGIAIGVVLVVGLVQGLLITQLGLQPFIVTLGFMLLIRGVSQTIAEGGTLSFGNLPFRNLADNGILLFHGEPLITYPVLIFLIVIVLSICLLHLTVFGRYVYVIGGNRAAAEYSGVPVRGVMVVTYLISAGLAGVAGICDAAYIKQMSHTVGLAYELSAIAACVLGGCSLLGGEGSILGVVVGSTIMCVIDNGLNMFRIPYRDRAGVEQQWHPNENWHFIVIGAVILIAVILDQLVHIIQTRRRTRRAGVMARQIVEPVAAPRP